MTALRKRPNSNAKTSKSAKKQKLSKAFEKQHIPIPEANDSSDDDSDLSEQDIQFFVHRDASFLNNLDQKGIARSKKELIRLHILSKPHRKPRIEDDDDLPSLDSHDEDDLSCSSAIDDHHSQLSATHSDASSSALPTKRKESKHDSSDEEMPYEKHPRAPRKLWISDQVENGIERLPIKLHDGRLQRSGVKVFQQIDQTEEETDSDEMTDKDNGDGDGDDDDEVNRKSMTEDVATGARFGRAALTHIISIPSRKARIQAAKDQIAGICQDIIADPENSLGLLRRLHSFSLPEISSPSHPEPVTNDNLIRKLAILSQMAVFRDIIPGYRIRPLSDKEKAEKVSQMVQRARDFEQGLVGLYQLYLRTLESELKAKGELSEVALQCICKLLVDLTHFNFRTNLMSAVVARLSKRSWDQTSDLCSKTLSTIFRTDKTGEPSLEIIRLLNRMIKERKFNVHPNVMFCLLDLRLKTELGGVRASQSKAEKEKPIDTMSKGRAAARRAKGKFTAQPHLSKAAKKKVKETRVIEEEMKEAEAEVDNEEKANMQTETLKLVFVLYFRILKNDKPSRLLSAALQGITKYAHLVNVDFFKDLLDVLRQIVSHGMLGNTGTEGEKGEENEYELEADVRDVHLRLHCIVTAFELLSGQGEALNIDLTDFVNALYAMLLPLSTMPGIETIVTGTANTRKNKGSDAGETPADMLFRALDLIFTSRSPSMGKSPPWRTAAFTKRLLTASLCFPPETARRTITFVQKNLFAREPKLESLLSTEDRIADGLYRPEVDDPQVCNPFASSAWEVHHLATRHVDPEVRRLATELSSFSYNQS